MKRFFVTGIGTGVGKTLAAAVITEALGADYWKPVQTGPDEERDMDVVRRFVRNASSRFHPEAYHFKTPASPHLAAARENARINLDAICLPASHNPYVVVEGAGGLLVPLNAQHYVIDIAKRLEAQVILVCRSYLGCINHSLLSLDYLQRHGFQVGGLVLNGDFDPLVKSAIVSYTSAPVVAQLPELEGVTPDAFARVAAELGPGIAAALANP